MCAEARSCFPTGEVNRDRWARRRQGDVAGLVATTESQAATKQVLEDPVMMLVVVREMCE